MSEPPEEGIVSSRGELLLYATEDGHSRVECRFAEDTLWLSQTAMMELYQTTRPNVSLHLKNIFEESELDEEAVVKSYLTTAADGKSYQIKHYSLETKKGILTDLSRETEQEHKELLENLGP